MVYVARKGTNALVLGIVELILKLHRAKLVHELAHQLGIFAACWVTHEPKD